MSSEHSSAEYKFEWMHIPVPRKNNKDYTSPITCIRNFIHASWIDKGILLWTQKSSINPPFQDTLINCLT